VCVCVCVCVYVYACVYVHVYVCTYPGTARSPYSFRDCCVKAPSLKCWPVGQSTRRFQIQSQKNNNKNHLTEVTGRCCWGGGPLLAPGRAAPPAEHVSTDAALHPALITTAQVRIAEEAGFGAVCRGKEVMVPNVFRVECKGSKLAKQAIHLAIHL